jgi:hypothetical protein
MGRESYFAGWRIFQFEAIGPAAVYAALQLLLVGEQFDRPDRQPDEAREEQARDDVHALAMRMVLVRFPIALWRHTLRPDPRLPRIAGRFIAKPQQNQKDCREDV